MKFIEWLGGKLGLSKEQSEGVSAMFDGLFLTFLIGAVVWMLINDSCEICYACSHCYCKEIYYPPVDVQQYWSNINDSYPLRWEDKPYVRGHNET